jgi:initiation factor 1A
MPNRSGGKGYKRQKKGGDEFDPEKFAIDRQPDQLVARAVRMLGDRNVLCYCQDDRLRICHICNRMKKFKIWVEAGDIVLISLRDFNLVENEGHTAADKNATDKRRGDILAKYPKEILGKLRKEAGMNQKLFNKLEGMEGINLESVGVDKSRDTKIQQGDGLDDLFDAESEEDSDGSDESDDGQNKIVKTKGKRVTRADAATAAEMEGDDDIDIDAI